MASGLSSKHLYRETLEQVHSYNSKLLLDRRLRIPHIDSHTGIAQQDSHLWVSAAQRCTPVHHGQLHSYPSRRWIMRKRPDFVGINKTAEQKQSCTVLTDDHEVKEEKEGVQDSERSFESEESVKVDSSSTDLQPLGYDDRIEEELYESDFDSDEEFGSRKKKRKTSKNNKGNKKNLPLKFATKKDESLRQNGEEKQKYFDDS